MQPDDELISTPMFGRITHLIDEELSAAYARGEADGVKLGFDRAVALLRDDDAFTVWATEGGYVDPRDRRRVIRYLDAHREAQP